MTQKYVKKPVQIEAVRVPEIPCSIFAINMMHDWVELMREQGIEAWMGETDIMISSDGIRIPNSAGAQTAKPGDWIIKGLDGEFYPCTDEVFQQTYDLVPFEES